MNIGYGFKRKPGDTITHGGRGNNEDKIERLGDRDRETC